MSDSMTFVALSARLFRFRSPSAARIGIGKRGEDLKRVHTCLLALTALGLAAAAGAVPRDHRVGKVETVDLPPGVGKGGTGMIYVDEEAAPVRHEADELVDEIAQATGKEGLDLLLPMNQVYTDLRRGLVRYRARWSGLPQIQIPEGPALKAGQEGERVALLRQRLGLPAGTAFDKALAAAVREYQQVHGLEADGIAAAATIASLNRGAEHYERLIQVNLERARSLPADARERYVLVDAAAARLWLYEGGKVVDSMKVIVGSNVQKTPMMAAMLRFAEVNPYWNVPPDFVQEKMAPRILAEGVTYLTDRRYQVLSDWGGNPQVIDPASIDWQAVADGREKPRIRQLPGGNNSMGGIKFMMPNEYGIYLHDTPNKALFDEKDRWISNGCVRVEDAKRLAAWLFGAMPQGKSPDVEERVDLPAPVPVYITYMTAAPARDGIVFRADPYERDPTALARMFGAAKPVETAALD